MKTDAQDRPDREAAIAMIRTIVKTLPDGLNLLLAVYYAGYDAGRADELKQFDKIAGEHGTLTMLLRSILSSKYFADCDLKKRASGYMTRKQLWGSLLRSTDAPTDESRADEATARVTVGEGHESTPLEWLETDLERFRFEYSMGDLSEKDFGIIEAWADYIRSTGCYPKPEPAEQAAEVCECGHGWPRHLDSDGQWATSQVFAVKCENGNCPCTQFTPKKQAASHNFTYSDTCTKCGLNAYEDGIDLKQCSPKQAASVSRDGVVKLATNWWHNQSSIYRVSSGILHKLADFAIKYHAEQSKLDGGSAVDRELGRIAELESEVVRMSKCLDAIYNHNEAARVAVVEHYGLHHSALVRECIAKKLTPASENK